MGLFDFFKQKKTKSEAVVPLQSITVSEKDKQLSVILKEIPKTYHIEKSRLVEITDSAVLARIDALIPSTGTVLVNIGKYRKHCPAIERNVV